MIGKLWWILANVGSFFVIRSVYTQMNGYDIAVIWMFSAWLNLFLYGVKSFAEEA